MVVEQNQVRKKVLKIALPIVLEQVAVVLIGVINTIMVSRLNKEAVSAVGIIDMLGRCIFPLFSGLATGTTILIAHFVGENDEKKASETGKQALYIGTVCSVVLTVVMFFITTPLLNLLYGRVDALVMQYAVSYYRITIVAYPFILIRYIVNGILRGSGDTKTPLKITILMNCISAVVSYYLVYMISTPAGGEERGLGVVGAALGITIARIIGAVASVRALLHKNLRVGIKDWNQFKPRKDIFSEVLKIGVPYGLEQFFMQTGKLILQIIITGMGTVAIAANTIGMSIMSLSITTGYGFNLAAVTLTGQALGAGDCVGAKKCTREVMKLDLLVMCFTSALIAIFTPQLLSLYTDKQEVIACGIKIIRIYAVSQPFLAVVQVLTGTLRGAGDTKYPMITTFIGVWVFRLVIGYILGVICNLGINGVWIAMTADLVLRAILYIVRYQKGTWMSLWNARKEVTENKR